MNRRVTKLTPFLKWAGGKQRLLAQFDPFFPEGFDTYIEPFLGGGAVFFHVCEQFRPSRLVLSDSNEELIDCYHVVKDDPEALIERLEDHKQQLSKDYFYEVRAWEADALSPFERAARLIFLNKTCFNGLYRVNRQGKFNVPFGRYKNPRIYAPDQLRLISQVLKHAELSVRDFSECVQDAGEQTFVYMDPPYYPLSVTANFTSYTPGAFSAEDQQRLAKVFGKLSNRQAYAMGSNSDCDAVRELYAAYRLETVWAHRAINSRGDRRGQISELLILNY